RIGRIDRLGQDHDIIRVVNLYYQDTVETDVYCALRQRYGLFTQYVGRLQPILSTLPREIADVVLAGRRDEERRRDELVSKLDSEVEKARSAGFDLDEATEAELEMPPRPRAYYDLDALDALVRRPELLPPGVEVRPLGPREYQLSMPGMSDTLRVTTDAEY